MKLHFKSLCLALSVFGSIALASAAVETYDIDPVHSSVGFSVRHIFTKVPGSFTKFAGTITVDREHLEKSAAEATIEIASINTANEKRDNHLRSVEFFDVAKHPQIAFKSKSWKKTGEDTFDVTGDLTIRGVTKEVVLKAKVLGFGPGMTPDSQVSGWEATARLNRRDFGVNGPPLLGQALGDEVDVTITVEAGLKKL